MTAVRDILRTMDYGVAPESDAHARAWLAAIMPEITYGHSRV